MSARSLLAGLATSAVVASATTMLTLAPAHADPTSTPDANDIVGVGSDTTEFALDYLADGTNGVAGYNTGKAASDALLATFDTLGSAQITLRQGSDPINRPVGSGAGKGMLYGSTNNPDVTFARSSSAISTTEKQAGLEAFPFAVDSLQVAVSGLSTHAPASLTPAQILGIFKGDITNWSDVGGTAGVIDPYVPPGTSGTRKFFDAQLASLNGGAAVVYGGHVNQQMHENVDDDLKNNPNAVAPFSVGKANVFYPSTVRLEDGFSAKRDLYNVVRGTDLGNAQIQAIFGESGFVCSTDARPLIEAAGFQQLATPAHGGVCGQATSDPASNFVVNQQQKTRTTLGAASKTARHASLVATVTSGSAPDGTVDFYEGAALLQSDVPLVSGRATYVASGAPGNHTYTAKFVPAAGSVFDPSQDDATSLVKTSSKIAETFPATVAKGKRATGTVTVTLAGIASKATGTVKVLKGTATLAKAKLVHGKASVKLPKLAKGLNHLKIVWKGDQHAAGSHKAFAIRQK